MTDEPRELAIDAAVLFTDTALPFGEELCMDEFNRRLTLALEAYAARKVAEERERCARIADNGATLVENWDIKFTSPARIAADLARDIADAIRKEPS